MRLQRYIALCGITSRRKAEKLIVQGRVKVNGIIEKELGTRVNTNKDEVMFDNKIIKPEEKDVYIMLNKPKGYVTTLDDEFDRPIVTDLTSEIKERIYPVGRLDIDTKGLLLLTNDGILTNKMTHPSYEVKKTYEAFVQGIPNEEKIKKFESGLTIEGFKTAKAQLNIIDIKNGNSVLEITIHEGRNRQVRKMCSHIGHDVIDLKRIRMGNLCLEELEEGKWRYLTKNEIEKLKRL